MSCGKLLVADCNTLLGGKWKQVICLVKVLYMLKTGMSFLCLGHYVVYFFYGIFIFM